MRFLIKAGFWLTIIVLLLPADPASRDRAPHEQQVGAFEAIGVAQAALEDVTGFCARRPDACETGTQAFQTFGQKAQHGAKLLYEFLTERFAEAPAKPVSSRANSRVERLGRDTLNPADLLPEWRSPEAAPVPMPRPRPA